jgi:hypothetical protein
MAVAKHCLGWCLALLISGCVSTAPRGLSLQEIQSLRLESVEGAVANDAAIEWPALEDEYLEPRIAAAGPQPPGERNREAIARLGLDLNAVASEIRKAAAVRFNTAVRSTMEGQLRTVLAGTRPVRAKVTLHGVSLPSLGQRFMRSLFFGTATDKSMLLASVALIDTRTGATLVNYPATSVSVPGGRSVIDLGGEGMLSSDPLIRLLTVYRGGFVAWLSQS